MNGPSHYREAEKFARLAAALFSSNQGPTEMAAAHTAAVLAGAHATLAQTAAIATLDAVEGPHGGSTTGRTDDDWQAWQGVLGGGESS